MEDVNTKFDIKKVQEEIKKDASHQPLTDAQTSQAKKELIIQYPKIKRHIIDPPLKTGSKNQKLGMFSWYPSKGAKPDVNGIYGVIILRGCFKTEAEAEARATYLIQNVDSKHELYIAEVGCEKPLCVDNKYVNDIKIIESTVDKSKKEHEEEVRKEQENTQKQIEQKKRELEDDVKRDPNEVDIDMYITKLIKLSNINQHYNDQKTEMLRCEDIIKRTKSEVIEIEHIHPEYKDQFISKMEATFVERGIPVDVNKIKQNFDEILQGIREDHKSTK